MKKTMHAIQTLAIQYLQRQILIFKGRFSISLDYLDGQSVDALMDTSVVV